MNPTTMTKAGIPPDEILRLRLASQQIAGSRLTAPGEVVAWLGAVQAQDYPGALWSVGLRLPGSTAAGIGQAVTDKTLVRTWLMRGTLHLVAAMDLCWMLALLAPGIIKGNQRRYRELGLDEETFARSNPVIGEAVEGGRNLTRTELVAILEKNGIPAGGQRAPYILQRASLDGLICQGAPRGNKPVFFSPALLPGGEIPGRGQALADLAARYFTGHMPATLRDFAGWSGLPLREARDGFGAVSSRFEQTRQDDRKYILSPSRPPEHSPEPAVHLLPGFDEFILGYRDRCALPGDPGLRKMVLKNGMLSPTIIINGRVAGTWKRSFRKGTAVLAIAPFAPLSGAEQETLAATARRYGEFLGMPVEVA
jgi:hypothetical protein